MLSGQLSPDGLWIWDGGRWVSTLSPDGLWRWDGYRWVPLMAYPPLMPAPRGVSRWQRTLIAVCAAALVGGGVVAAFSASARSGNAPAATVLGRPPASPVAGATADPGRVDLYPGAPQGTRVFDVPSRNHTAGHVEYPQTPPVGGVHAPIWLNCGVYDRPVPNENAVHSMEHGVVWVTYDPDALSNSEIAGLRRLVASTYAGSERYVILSPYPNLGSPVVASAWGVQLRLAAPETPALRQFIDYFRQGPETPELGGRCTGGVGAPVDGQGGGQPLTLRSGGAVRV